MPVNTGAGGSAKPLTLAVPQDAGQLDHFREPAPISLTFDLDPEDDRYVIPPAIAVHRCYDADAPMG